jgi:hypothetical protein
MVARKAHCIDCTVLFRCYLSLPSLFKLLSGQLQQPTNPAPVALPVLSCRGIAWAVHMLPVALKHFKDCAVTYPSSQLTLLQAGRLQAEMALPVCLLQGHHHHPGPLRCSTQGLEQGGPVAAAGQTVFTQQKAVVRQLAVRCPAVVRLNLFPHPGSAGV